MLSLDNNMRCLGSLRNPKESGVMVTLANKPIEPLQVPYIDGFVGCLVHPNNAIANIINSVFINQR